MPRQFRKQMRGRKAWQANIMANMGRGRQMTPQEKIMAVSKKFGNDSIADQQGSTIIKYDTLPLDGRTEFRFFDGSAQRNFPLSNTESDGNKLGVGDTMVVARAYVSIVDIDAVTQQISGIAPLTLAADPALLGSQFNFEIANVIVIKNVPILSWTPEFNKDAENALSNSFEFDTQVVIEPLLQFVARVQSSDVTVQANRFLRLTLEGTGSIINPKQTV